MLRLKESIFERIQRQDMMAASLLASICLVSLLSTLRATTVDRGKFIVGTPATKDVKSIRLGPSLRNEDKEKPVSRISIDSLDSVLPKDCGRRFLTGGRISGGYTARLGEFPSFARVDILIKNQTWSYISLCGGTLISERHVLTAAHCFIRNMTVAVNVSLTIYPRIPYGGDPLSPVYAADKLCVSPKYNTSDQVNYMHHDMALVRLARPVKFDRYVQPACLPQRPAKGKERLKAVGLGIFWMSPSNGSDYLVAKRLQVLPVKWAICENPKDLHFAKFCVDPEDPWYVGSSCGGDSGSPIYGFEDGRIVVVGITSYGTAVCQQGVASASVETDVYGARDELAQLMKECQ